MKLELIPALSSISKAYQKQKPTRNDVNKFKVSLDNFVSSINPSETEEHNKTLFRDFLKNAFYSKYFLNTKGFTDLAIYLGDNADSKVGVIIEVKSPSKKQEMITRENFNVKSFHETVLYYMRERINGKNDDIKHIIITNMNELYIYDAQSYESIFYNNSNFRKSYSDWASNKKVSNNTEHFYKEIVKPFVAKISETIPYLYFNLIDYSRLPTENREFLYLFKVLSSINLLKESFLNDSNTLDKQFYNELLHIIGLEETKEGRKKVIKRKVEKHRESGSLLENTILKLKAKDITNNILLPERFGDSKDEQLFNIALELNITWVNRILFLKLLEAQLISYHNGDKSYKFLEYNSIKEFDNLHELFHEILSVKPQNREKDAFTLFKKIPYLNSSLFEFTELERNTIDISNLKDRYELSLYSSTVLKNDTGKRLTGKLSTLQYILRFLDAYDFSSEGSGEIQEENKTLINASVLGLIFEKINGYKEGSYFTPGIITTYICDETLEKAVINKFNEINTWNCNNIEELRDRIEYSNSQERARANEIINSIKICDPAVGSGHFLVSALNKLIAIKSDLKILNYRDGSRIKEYKIHIDNDEVIVTDTETEAIFEYNLNQKGHPYEEKQKFQEALFHEKQTIIENCLFGVDINPNSVNICRLRLWIELLKNSYYTKETSYSELETLPNIDINIKRGHSLVSRYGFDVDINKILKSKKMTVRDYLNYVDGYKNSKNKEDKRYFSNFIENIKKGFRQEISKNDPRRKKLSELEYKLNYNFRNDRFIDIEFSESDKKAFSQKEQVLMKQIEELSTELKAEETGEIYRNAFEWRFEFPEVLDNSGKFIGFDVVIGNPPYVFGGNEGISSLEKEYYKKRFKCGSNKINLFTLFIEMSTLLLRNNGVLSLIIPNTFLRVTSYHLARKYFIDSLSVLKIRDIVDNVFEDAITTAIIVVATNSPAPDNHHIKIEVDNKVVNKIKQSSIKESGYIISLNLNDKRNSIIHKLESESIPLGEIAKELIFGVVITKNRKNVVSSTFKKGWKPFLEGKDISSYEIRPVKKYLHYVPELLHRPRTKEIFEVKEKLLIQRITGGTRPIKAAYDCYQYYNKESINNLILHDNSDFEIKYILAIINSKLINWYYAQKFTNNSKLTVNLSKEYLSKIPIKIADAKVQKSICAVVNSILKLKQKESSNDTSSLENTINQMVYKLYNLEESEINIIESSIIK